MFWILILLLLFGCEDSTTSEYQFNINPRLEIDENGYYHLDVIRQNRQTLHRINGLITKDGESVESIFFEWS